MVEEDEPDGALASLADAVEQTTVAPYRAEAVRRGPTTWAVAALADRGRLAARADRR